MRDVSYFIVNINLFRFVGETLDKVCRKKEQDEVSVWSLSMWEIVVNLPR